MGGWLMVESCGGRLQKSCWGVCSSVVWRQCWEDGRGSILGFYGQTRMFMCICSRACLVWSDNKERLQWPCWDEVCLMCGLVYETSAEVIFGRMKRACCWFKSLRNSQVDCFCVFSAHIFLCIYSPTHDNINPSCQVPIPNLNQN